jgi:hypothetical protein
MVRRRARAVSNHEAIERLGLILRDAAWRPLLWMRGQVAANRNQGWFVAFTLMVRRRARAVSNHEARRARSALVIPDAASAAIRNLATRESDLDSGFTPAACPGMTSGMRRRAVSNHEAIERPGLILRDARKSGLLRMRIWH